jgi:hypothetical protein
VGGRSLLIQPDLLYLCGRSLSCAARVHSEVCYEIDCVDVDDKKKYEYVRLNQESGTIRQLLQPVGYVIYILFSNYSRNAVSYYSSTRLRFSHSYTRYT